MQAGQQPLHVVVDDGQAHLRAATLEPAEDAGDERGQRGGEAAQAQPAVPASGDLGQLLLGGVEAGDHGAYVPDQGRSGLGELHGARPPLDQLHAQCCLQRRDLLARRRLGHAQRVGGGGERSPFGDLVQDPETATLLY